MKYYKVAPFIFITLTVINESPLKMINNAFYVILKALVDFKIFLFLS